MSREIWNIISDKESDIKSIMQQWYDHDFEKVINYIYVILNKNELDVETILKLYATDSRHLEYLAEEPHEVFTLNIINCINPRNLLDFVLDNHYLTTEETLYIIKTLGTDISYATS